MLNYTIVGNIGLLLDRRPVTPEEEHLLLSAPAGTTVWVNGHLLSEEGGTISIPVASLHTVNTVRMKGHGGSRRCEGFRWDGTSATPAGYDADAVVLQLVAIVADMATRLRRVEREAKGLREQIESPMFFL